MTQPAPDSRHTVDSLTDDELQQLYDERDRLAAELEALRHPELFDGTVNDIGDLYAIHEAITDSGGQLTRPVHRALDALRTRWDLALRHEQQRSQRAALDAHTNPGDQT
ncbi:hypothetical protein [Streptomyces gardneri]|uniref:hypothetical protein n=1 Tax=Streptomyces gardneri TaxID=66892 RepID=UPI0033C8A433